MAARYYRAVALNLCERVDCGHEHRKVTGARRCVPSLRRHHGEKLIRVFGYTDSEETKIVHREEHN